MRTVRRTIKHEKPWWSQPVSSKRVHEAVCSQFSWLDREQDHHRRRNLTHLRAYSNRLAATMSGAAFAAYDPWAEDRLRLNVIQAVVDAAVAQAAANAIRPMPLTQGGNWSAHRRAKGLQEYFDAMCHKVGQQELALQVFQDAATFGTSVQKTYAGYGRVCAERILIDNIVVDDVEAQAGEAGTIFEYREAPKERLIERYGEHEKAIEMSRLLRDDHWGRHRLADPGSVIEVFKLPTYPGADDGRHFIGNDQATFLYERWDRMRTPYSVFRWKRSPVGWYGLGVAEELMPLQIEINTELEKKQRILWLANYQLWVKRGTVAQSDLTNDEAAVRQFDETPPVAFPINTGVGELDAHIENLYRKAFEIVGISQLQALAQKPAGLNSGEAQRVYNANVSARFMHTIKRFERFHEDCAWRLVDAERDLRKADEDFESEPLYTKSKYGLRKVDFDKVIVDDEELQIQVFPTSLLPAEPAGKLATIKEMAEISPDMQKMLVSQLDFPDTEKALSLINAPNDLFEMLLEEMLEGRYRAPEANWPLQMLKDLMQPALIRAQLQAAPEHIQQLIRDFISSCDEMLNPQPDPMAAAPGAPPPPGGPVPAPGAPPMPQPPMPAQPMPGAQPMM